MDRGMGMHKTVKTEDCGGCWCCEEPECEVAGAIEVVNVVEGC